MTMMRISNAVDEDGLGRGRRTPSMRTTLDGRWTRGHGMIESLWV